MNVETMEAGPELNRLVHERVMGQCWQHHWEAYCADPPVRPISKNRRCTRCGLIVTQDTRGVYPIPSYSSDIKAAWRVVERMMELGWYMRLCSPLDPTDVYSVRFAPTHVSDDQPTCSASAETAPLAICRAALKAVEQDRV